VTVAFVALGAALGAPLRYLTDQAVQRRYYPATLATLTTFGYDTIRMAEEGARLAAVLNAAASIITALDAAYCGMALAHPITARQEEPESGLSRF